MALLLADRDLAADKKQTAVRYELRNRCKATSGVEEIQGKLRSHGRARSVRDGSKERSIARYDLAQGMITIDMNFGVDRDVNVAVV